MIRPMQAGDKAPALGLIRATEFFTAGEVGRRNGRVIIIETSSQPKYHGTRQFSIDRVIYAKYFR
jgi:hypothetical protein